MAVPAPDLASEIVVLRQENNDLRAQNRVLTENMAKIWEQNQELMKQNQEIIAAYKDTIDCIDNQNKRIKNLEDLIQRQPTKKILWGAFASGIATALSGVASLFLMLK